MILKVLSVRISQFAALALVPLALGLIALACSDSDLPSATEDDEAGTGGLLRVVTTVSPITSLTENVGGTRITLEGIVPEGVNSHTYEPAPSVARVMSEADLIILNGLFLEEPALKMAEANRREGAVILTLGDKAITRDDWVFDFSFPESGGRPNPHLWTSPPLALKYAELIRDALAELDPANQSYFVENYDSLKGRIEDLDSRIAAAVKSVPEDSRKLLTYHDSFPFFAQRYGFEVIGAVQPSDFSDPSAREVADLIDQVKESGVPAVFGSEVFPSPVMEQIAKEGGATFVDQLRDDDLPGSHGDPRHSYLGMMATNIEIMIPALGGNADSMSGFDAGPVFEGESGAIYSE